MRTVFLIKKTRKQCAFGAFRNLSRFKRTIMTFSYPDYTVGPGVSPDPAPFKALAGFTADWELLTLTLPRRCLFNLHPEYTTQSLSRQGTGSFKKDPVPRYSLNNLHHDRRIADQGCQGT